MKGHRNWICCQIGAREHYAAPKALQRAGRLDTLYTDYWAGSVVRALADRMSCGLVHSLAARYHPELSVARVVSWNSRALAWEAKIRLQAQRGESKRVEDTYIGYVEVGRRFAIRVRESLKTRVNVGPNTVLFGYDTGSLEALEWCREREIGCVLNQMDPNRVEVDLVCKESKRWPGWQVQSVDVPEEYFRRREHEWAIADRIVVNSEFSRQALIQQGVPPNKLVVMPLCYEAQERARDYGTIDCRNPDQRKEGSRPLRILFLGQVILRKGIQYLIQAARLLEHENIRFDVVGPIGISKDAMASVPRNVVFHGRATRDETGEWYRQADLFVLPTLSDGFAITQIEAMAYGLPVVATPCCGQVVTDGVDGFIIPPRDAEALAKKFQRYLNEPELLQAQGEAALIKSKQFTLGHLSANLLKLEQSLFQS